MSETAFLARSIIQTWETSNRITAFLIENLPEEITYGVWKWSSRAKEIE